MFSGALGLEVLSYMTSSEMFQILVVVSKSPQ